MPPLHILIKRVLLAGAAGPPATPVAVPAPPACLQPLVAACKPTHERFNARAVAFGNRYRSAFWAIYMLSAFAALCATLPAALGWDQSSSAWHSYAGLWGVAEVLVIASVGVVYWRGHKEHWQEQWLAARTNAELAWYLPLVAPLVDFTRRHASAGWYARVFDPGAHLREASDIDQLCTQLEPQAVRAQEALWGDAAAVRAYANWACAIMEEQRQYHRRVGAEQHQLLHRVHKISTCLFALTALGAALHLVVHSLWLSMVTVFFPALGAALHGALAQSEAFRMEQNSARLVQNLGQAIREIKLAVATDNGMQEGVADAVQGAVALILEEHQDWHGTVRPHHIPLA